MENKRIEDVIDLVLAEAWRYAIRWGLDIDDVAGQALLYTVEAEKRYDPNKAAFTTFVVSSLQQLNRWCLKEKDREKFYYPIPETETGDELIGTENYTDDSYAFVEMEAVESLTPDAFTILSTVAHGEYYDPERYNHKAGTRDIIRDSLGWPPARFRPAFDEARAWWHDRVA